MKTLIIVGITVGATIFVLILIWLAYYTFKAIFHKGGNNGERKVSATVAIDGISPQETTKVSEKTSVAQDTLTPTEGIINDHDRPTTSSNKVETNAKAPQDNNLAENITLEILNEDNVKIRADNKTKQEEVKKLQEQERIQIRDIRQKILVFQHIQNDRSVYSRAKIDNCINAAQTLILTPLYRRFTVELQRAKSNLIIAVDARPSVQAGYCLNLKEKWLQYYVIKNIDFPWTLHDQRDTTEFEMKNFIFALTIWYDEIIRSQSFQIFTDNRAINHDTKYGNRTQQLLRHFSICEKVKVANISSIHINRTEDIESFALFLKPADDFSRWKITKAVKFLCDFYGIGNAYVTGTHFLQRPATARRNARYDPTYFYNQVLQTAQQQIPMFGSNCSRPLCSKILLASLRGQQVSRNRGRLY